MLTGVFRKFNTSSTPFVVPTLLNGPTIVLPPSLVHELCTTPDSELDFRQAVIIQGLQADYLFPSTAHNPFHATAIRRQLTHSMVRARAASVMEEVRRAMEERWGRGDPLNDGREDWVEVKTYDSVVAVLTQITMFVFIGTPLCRNREFLQICISLFADVRLNAGLLNLLPNILQG